MAGGVLAPLTPASADSCFETPDTGWVCTPDANDATYLIDSSVPIGGPGQLPGATDPSAYVVDPVAYAEKEQLVADDQEAIAENLAAGVNTSPPPDTAIPSSPDPYQPNGGNPPNSYQASIVGYAQGNEPWCVGASTATILSSYGVSSSISRIEGQEGWKPGDKGTHMGNAKVYLDNNQHFNYYVYDQAGNQSQVFSHVTSDIYHKSAPVMIGVGTQGLSWWSNVPKDFQGPHALTVYAYYTSSAGGFSVWDSAGGNSGKAGKFRIAVSSTWAAMGLDGNAGQEIW